MRDQCRCAMQQACSPVNVASGCHAHREKECGSQRKHGDEGKRTQECFLQQSPLLGARNEVFSYLCRPDTGTMRKVSPTGSVICEHAFAAGQCLKHGSKDSTLTKVFKAKPSTHCNFFHNSLPSSLCPLCYRGII